ncbi:response regulator [uncultured Treponema sp.]|uniref:response regulator n=1 Tax=uncultured Treponema sp. TaxID=162155 RepID=UPI0025DF31AF|nr:response regulator [uncultured Treponema sp.]
MEENKYDSYFLVRKKVFRLTIPLTTIICLILLLIIEHIGKAVGFELSFNGWIAFKSRIYLEIIPVMLLTTLSGYTAGSFVVLLFFSIETIASHAFPYHSFVLLMASLVANIPALRIWYKSVFRTFQAVFLFAFILGNGWNILIMILEGREIFMEAQVFLFILAVVPSAIVCALCYLYYNCIPENIKNLFLGSTYDSDEIMFLKAAFARQKGRRIRAKLANLIIAECAVLLIAGFGFANALLEQFRNVTQWQQVVFATRLVILMMIVSVPAILFAFSYTNVSITRPLQLLTKAVEDSNVCNLTEHTRDVPRIDIKSLNIKSKDEIEILYRTILEMLSTTESYIKNLERSQLLETQLATAKAANKAKTEFLSNMSHEIRTPINAVLGLNEMIIRESKDKAITKYAKDIETAGKGLLSIVNDILDFSKIEAGKLEVIPTNYDLSSSINDLINMISKRAEDKNIKFNIDVESDMPHLLYGDDVRIKQCIVNILTNAVKYTNKGSVTLSVSGKKVDYSHVMLTVHVVDTGIGIKDKDIPKLFTAFQRIEEERNRTIEGTGLGLNIVQSLLTLMNSRLEVESVYGKGSDFHFSVLQGVIDWKPIGDFKETYNQTVKKSTGYHELFKAPNAKILVVDDTELNLTVVKGLLKQTEIQVDTVISGYDAIDVIQKEHYDIIFLDHRMPGMDGIQTFKKMLTLKNNKSKNVPVIALTANAVSGAKEMFLTTGFTDYMTKPIEGKKLEELILQYLPEELVEHIDSSAADIEEIAVLDENGEVVETGPVFENENISKLTGISLDDALKYTGGEDVLVQTLKEFYKVIDKKSQEIEQFVADKDWRNYTILVHALKSSARLIGAAGLSEDAKYLEKCGDDENEAEIVAKTPDLLKLYRSYKEHLAPLCAEETDDSGKEEMSLEQYLEAVSNIGECAAAYDYDTADQIIAMMKDYKLPAEKKQHFQDLCDAVSAVNQEQIINLTKV